MNPLLLVDSYKIHHTKMYPDGMTKLYSNFTPRKSRIEGINAVVVFGLQHFILEYLIKQFNENFFGPTPISRRDYPQLSKDFKDNLITEYQRHCNVDTKHIEDLWDLGYLPIEIKALNEGTLCPIGVPMLTITNTHPDFAWLVNYLETLISCMLWQPITSATIAYEYKKILNKYALKTTGTVEGVQWQGHDFSMRGMSSSESSILSGMGHLLSFTGTDTIPAIYTLETSYNATGLIGASVPATEHSVMCVGTKESEIETFKRLLDLYPTGILSVVSDTWDLWKVCTEYLPTLKEQILARDGKLVIRPDSGDPVDIICGNEKSIIYNDNIDITQRVNWTKVDLGNGFPAKWLVCKGIVYEISTNTNSSSDVKFIKRSFNPEQKGVIELLWDTFGGTINKQGYKVLDSHIGAIYGDAITRERCIEICERLKAKGFASTNIVFGIGSYTYQHNTRDTFGMAMKATYGELTRKSINPATGKEIVITEAREIFKDPITDDGTKRSKKGLLSVLKLPSGKIHCEDQVNWDMEQIGLLKTVFKNGKLVKETTLEEIRKRLNN